MKNCTTLYLAWVLLAENLHVTGERHLNNSMGYEQKAMLTS